MAMSKSRSPVKQILLAGGLVLAVMLAVAPVPSLADGDAAVQSAAAAAAAPSEAQASTPAPAPAPAVDATTEPVQPWQPTPTDASAAPAVESSPQQQQAPATANAATAPTENAQPAVTAAGGPDQSTKCGSEWKAEDCTLPGVPAECPVMCREWLTGWHLACLTRAIAKGPWRKRLQSGPAGRPIG